MLDFVTANINTCSFTVFTATIKKYIEDCFSGNLLTLFTENFKSTLELNILTLPVKFLILLVNLLMFANLLLYNRINIKSYKVFDEDKIWSHKLN